jgi:hypothetical protein
VVTADATSAEPVTPFRGAAVPALLASVVIPLYPSIEIDGRTLYRLGHRALMPQQA